MRLRWHHQRFKDYYGDTVLGYVTYVKGYVVKVHESPYIPDQGWYYFDGMWHGASSVWRAFHLARLEVKRHIKKQPWYPHAFYGNTFVRYGAAVGFSIATMKWAWTTANVGWTETSGYRFDTAEEAMRDCDKRLKKGRIK